MIDARGIRSRHLMFDKWQRRVEGRCVLWILCLLFQLLRTETKSFMN